MLAIEREYRLPPFGELHIVTSSQRGQGVKVVLQHSKQHDSADGSDDGIIPRADLFGSELVPGVAVQLPASRSLSIFTPQGCTLTVTAPPTGLQRCFVTASNAIWMRCTLDLHGHLELERMDAKKFGDIGPRVLFVSDRRHVGASTYIQRLSQYAVRLGYHPLLLDAASDHPQFGYPSSLSLYQLQYTLDIEEGTNYLPGVHAFVGKSAKTGAVGLYLHVLRQLLTLGLEKAARNDRCRVGGLFFDYGVVHRSEVEAAEEAVYGLDEKVPSREGRSRGGVLRLNPLDVLLDTIVEADIDHVFVVESAWLRFKLAQRAVERFGDRGKVAEMTLTPATVESDNGPCFRLFLLDGYDAVCTFSPGVLVRQRWLRYFFGTETSPVKPMLLHLETCVVRIASFGGLELGAMATLMPMRDDEVDGEDDAGTTFQNTASPLSLSFVTAHDVQLKGRILALSTATEMEVLPDGNLQRLPYAEFEKRVRQCTIMGFALVESVTDERITVLVNAAPLPKDLGLCFFLTEEYLLP